MKVQPIVLATLFSAFSLGHGQTVFEAPDVVVTPSRTPVALTDVPASTTVIPASVVELQGANTIDGLLQQVPGIELQSSDAPGENIKVNFRGLTSGFQSKRVLVLQDGRRLNEQYQGNAEFMTLPASHVERIEILRGPGSALYGSGAMGGVIHITTRRGSTPPQTALSASYGSFSTFSSTLRHAAEFGPLDYAFSAGYLETDGWMSRADGTKLDWEASHFDGNAGWQLDDDTALRIFLGGYRGEGNEFNNARIARKDYQMAELTRSFPDARDGELQIRAYRNGQRDTYDWTHPGVGLYDQDTLAAEVVHSLWISPAHRITAGSEVRREAVDADDFGSRVKEDNILLAAYLQDEWRPKGPFSMTSGLRVDRNLDFDTTLSPRIAGLYRISPQAEVFASYNRAHRAPALADRYASAVFFNMVFVGNPDLKPETLDAYEVGLRARPTDALRLESSLFLNDMRDSFESVFDPVQNAFRPENVSNARTYGIESAAHLACNEWIHLFATYTFTEGEYRSDPNPSLVGNRITYLARHKANGGIQLQARRAGTHELSVLYAGQRYADIDNEKSLDAYTVANWTSRIPLSENLWFRLNIRNLADVSYRHFELYEQPGRSVTGTLEMIF